MKKLFCLLFSIILLPNTNLAVLAQMPPTSNQIRSVSQIKNEIKGRLNPPSFCDTKGCLAPLNIEICTMVEDLNKRVNGKIIGKPIKSKSPLKITQKDLALMKKVWSQCKTEKAENVFIGVPGNVTIYSPSCEVHNQILKEFNLKEKMYKCDY